MNSLTSDPSKNQKLGHAVRLMWRVLGTRWFDRATLARELVMPPKLLNQYLDGDIPMPPDHQLRVATLVIDKIAPYARQGHRLRAQITASIAFHANETERHTEPPTQRWVVRAL